MVYQAISKLRNVQQVRALPQILENKKATQILLKGEGEKAYLDARNIVEESNPAAVGVFRQMGVYTKELERNYVEALTFLQKAKGNKKHLDIYAEFLESVLRLAVDSGRGVLVQRTLDRLSKSKQKKQA